MEVKINDGGRSKYFKGTAGDCVTRAVAIASEQDYMVVYKALSEGSRSQRKTKRSREKSSARDGVNTKRKWFRDYMDSIGFEWVSVMGIGTGCTTHLKAGELPKGRIICALSKHYCAVVDGVINDIYDCSRGETRCVYGYWKKKGGLKNGM